MKSEIKKNCHLYSIMTSIFEVLRRNKTFFFLSNIFKFSWWFSNVSLEVVYSIKKDKKFVKKDIMTEERNPYSIRSFCEGINSTIFDKIRQYENITISKYLHILISRNETMKKSSNHNIRTRRNEPILKL